MTNADRGPVAETDDVPRVPGWFGKIPCLGDFASRRLPAEFIEPWDRWLQSGLTASRQQLGERWLDVFLKSPMWRYLLAPAVCGDRAWAGLLLPSVDKVGRYFPLTFAVPVAADPAKFIQVFNQDEWYSGLEAIALSALTADFTVEQLELALSDKPYSSDSDASSHTPATRDLLACLESGKPAAFACSAGDMPLIMGTAASLLFASATASRSFWWSINQDSAATHVHCVRGLPPPENFVMFLGGSAAEQPPSSELPADPLQALGLDHPTDEFQSAG